MEYGKIGLGQEDFTFIKWEDEEPTNIDEVIEELENDTKHFYNFASFTILVMVGMMFLVTLMTVIYNLSKNYKKR